MSAVGKALIAGVMILAPSIGLVAVTEEGVVAITRQMKALNVNPRMVGNRDGVQIGAKIVLVQWQDGKRVIIWPEDLAPGKPRFPTPPWSQRP